jgi:uncharacterized protein (DUF433 family)
MSQVSIEHIEINPAGEAKLVGSRIKVKHLAAIKQSHGYTAEQIQQEVYPHLNLAQIHAALAYYYDHQSEIDNSLRSDDAAHEQAWQKQQGNPEYRELIDKMKRRDANP